MFTISASKEAWSGNGKGDLNPHFFEALHWELDEVEIFLGRLHQKNTSLGITEWCGLGLWMGGLLLNGYIVLWLVMGLRLSANVIWTSWVPSKEGSFAWEAVWGKILTLDKLKKRC